MIAVVTLAAALLAAVTGLMIFALVVTGVRLESRATRLPVESPGPLTALVRCVLGLHVRRTLEDFPRLRHCKSVRRH
jgi:hypothetical protein